jgi:hypothetical protein
MDSSNNMFERMCKEAADEMAEGGKGWRELPPNVVILACFHLLTNHLTHKLVKPLWWFAFSVCAAVIGYLISMILNFVLGG